MSTKRPAAGGGSEIFIAAERALKWLDGFDTRHRITHVEHQHRGIDVTAGDGSVARCRLPLPGRWRKPQDADNRDLIELFAQEAAREYSIGVVFARRAAVAVGVFDGARLVESKVDKSYVQGRTAAGGWSQQRYARRRSKQAKQAGNKAADIAARILVPRMNALRGIVTAGDRAAVTAIMDDDRLNGFGPSWPALVDDSDARAREDRKHHPRPWLMHIGDIGEPRFETLKNLPKRFRVVRILLHETDDEKV